MVVCSPTLDNDASMSNPRPELIKAYLKMLLASLEEKQKSVGGMMIEHCKRSNGSERKWTALGRRQLWDSYRNFTYSVFACLRGTFSRIALKMTPELSPRNGSAPVAIS